MVCRAARCSPAGHNKQDMTRMRPSARAEFIGTRFPVANGWLPRVSPDALSDRLINRCCADALPGPLPLGKTAGTRAAQVVADARLEETGVLRRTIGAGPAGPRSSPLC